MFTHYHAADFEVASRRARQRWAEHIEEMLDGASDDAAPALRAARDILLDPEIEVRSSDLHELLRVIRDDAFSADSPAPPVDAFVAAYRQSAA